MMKCLRLIIFSYALSFSAFAKTHNSTDVINQASQISLATHPTWLRLLHHESGFFQAPQGSITSKHFYLAPQGRHEPKQELQATIQAFFEHPATQCQFPARKLFLANQLSDTHFPQVECEDLTTYLDSLTTTSISIIYASGYLGNPASMFGHVFLKFNNENKHSLLDNTLSYGANVPDSDNKLTYILKGITGGYEGHFANQQYHHQQTTYNESELRDLWEYKLTLSKEDISLLAAHLWELSNTEMRYYFFKQNCAYQLAKLLELVTQTPLQASYKIWSMPFDVIMMLDKLDEQSPLISEVIYHGSRQQALYHKWTQLSEVEKDAVKALITSATPELPPIFEENSTRSTIQVIDTLYDYFAYIDVKQSGLSSLQLAKRKALLRQRFTLPAQQLEWQKAMPLPPHQAQDSALLQVSTLHNNNLGQIYELRFRANYYDMLGINPARIPFSELTTFDLKLRYQAHSAVKLHDFTLFRIINLNTSQTDLPEDRGYAWKLAMGYQAEDLSCVECSTAYIDGFWGKGWSNSPNWAIYSALSSRLTSSNNLGGNIAAGVEFGGVIHFTPSFALSLSAGHQKYLNRLSASRDYLNATQRYIDDKNMDIRSTIRFDGAWEYGLSFSLYY